MLMINVTEKCPEALTVDSGKPEKPTKWTLSKISGKISGS